MDSIKQKLGVGAALTLSLVATLAGVAHAAVDSAVVDLATGAGTSIKDTAIAVLTVLIPLAVGVFLARKALPWAKRMIS